MIGGLKKEDREDICYLATATLNQLHNDAERKDDTLSLFTNREWINASKVYKNLNCIEGEK